MHLAYVSNGPSSQLSPPPLAEGIPSSQQSPRPGRLKTHIPDIPRNGNAEVSLCQASACLILASATYETVAGHKYVNANNADGGPANNNPNLFSIKDHRRRDLGVETLQDAMDSTSVIAAPGPQHNRNTTSIMTPHYHCHCHLSCHKWSRTTPLALTLSLRRMSGPPRRMSAPYTISMLSLVCGRTFLWCPIRSRYCAVEHPLPITCSFQAEPKEA